MTQSNKFEITGEDVTLVKDEGILKQILREVDAFTEYFRGDYNEVEVGFVDGLFEMYKLRELIIKTKVEIPTKELMRSYNHRFGTSLFTSRIQQGSYVCQSVL